MWQMAHLDKDHHRCGLNKFNLNECRPMRIEILFGIDGKSSCLSCQFDETLHEQSRCGMIDQMDRIIIQRLKCRQDAEFIIQASLPFVSSLFRSPHCDRINLEYKRQPFIKEQEDLEGVLFQKPKEPHLQQLYIHHPTKTPSLIFLRIQCSIERFRLNQ